jgi:transposase InsO family protein
MSPEASGTHFCCTLLKREYVANLSPGDFCEGKTRTGCRKFLALLRDEHIALLREVRKENVLQLPSIPQPRNRCIRSSFCGIVRAEPMTRTSALRRRRTLSVRRCKTHEGRLPTLQGLPSVQTSLPGFALEDIAFANKSARVERGEQKSPNPSLRLLEEAAKIAYQRRPMSVSQARALHFVHDVIAAGRTIRVLSVIDACTRECLAPEVDTAFASRRVTRVLDKDRVRVVWGAQVHQIKGTGQQRFEHTASASLDHGLRHDRLGGINSY